MMESLAARLAPRARGTVSAGNADRADARARGGARTPGGKARSARNAMRHGLSLPIVADPATAAEVEALTRQMAPAADAETAELARAVAQAQVDLIRIRRARQNLLATTFTLLAATQDEAAPDDLGAARRLSDHLSNLAARLAAMDRYERRAFSRRKFAVRALCGHRPPTNPAFGGKGFVDHHPR